MTWFGGCNMFSWNHDFGSGTMTYLRPLIVLAVLAVVGWAGLRLFDPFGQPLLLQSVQAAPLEDGSDGSLALFLTIDNRGGPDRLIAATASDASETVLYAPESDGTIPLPGASTPLLASDGAHIVLRGVEGPLDDGRLFPVSLTFEKAGTVTARARLAAPVSQGDATQSGLFGLGDICRVEEGEPAPAISLRTEARPDGAGWRVIVDAEEFTFSKEGADKEHIPGVGHGHLYVSGLKLGRLYGPQADIGPLPPGEHTVRVTLNTNDHRAYVVDDEPVTAEATIVVK